MTHAKNTKNQKNNPEFLKELVQNYLQEYLEQEIAIHLGTLPYERTEDQRGKLFLSLPQTRDRSFSTELLERYQWEGGEFLQAHGVFSSTNPSN